MLLISINRLEIPLHQSINSKSTKQVIIKSHYVHSIINNKSGRNYSAGMERKKGKVGKRRGREEESLISDRNDERRRRNEILLKTDRIQKLHIQKQITKKRINRIGLIIDMAVQYQNRRQRKPIRTNLAVACSAERI